MPFCAPPTHSGAHALGSLLFVAVPPALQRVFALAVNAQETGVAPDALVAEIMQERVIPEPVASPEAAGAEKKE